LGAGCAFAVGAVREATTTRAAAATVSVRGERRAVREFILN
jgi:hypothetical protein